MKTIAACMHGCAKPSLDARFAAFLGMMAIASTALGQSPQSTAHSREHLSTWVELGDYSWHIRHTKNIDGSFILFRNSTAGVVTVSMDGADEKHLAPRGAATWDCLTRRSDERLAVWTESGDPIYSTRVECGDAVVAGTYFPSGEAAIPAFGEPAVVPFSVPAIALPRESGVASVEQTSSTIHVSGTSWRIRHTTNANGTFVLLRNTAGALSVIKDGEAPMPVAPQETLTWPCKGPGEIDAAIVVKAEAGEVVHTGYLECGDELYIGGDG